MNDFTGPMFQALGLPLSVDQDRRRVTSAAHFHVESRCRTCCRSCQSLKGARGVSRFEVEIAVDLRRAMTILGADFDQVVPVSWRGWNEQHKLHGLSANEKARR